MPDTAFAPLLAALLLGFALGGVLGAAAMVVLLARVGNALTEAHDRGAPPAPADEPADTAADLGRPALRRRLAERRN